MAGGSPSVAIPIVGTDREIARKKKQCARTTGVYVHRRRPRHLTPNSRRNHMRYKLLGKSGLRVTELCLGTMTFDDLRRGWGLGLQKMRAVLRAIIHGGSSSWAALSRPPALFYMARPLPQASRVCFSWHHPAASVGPRFWQGTHRRCNDAHSAGRPSSSFRNKSTKPGIWLSRESVSGSMGNA